MRVNYKGMDKKFKYRLAEISFDEDKEQTLMDKIEQVMSIKGYEIDQVTNGYALCEVKDMSEYREFVKDYKKIKKSAKMWIRFGF